MTTMNMEELVRLVEKAVKEDENENGSQRKIMKGI